MGFRLHRYTPVETTEDDASGLVGLTVVLAARKESTPASAIAAPIPINMVESSNLPGMEIDSDGMLFETNHIPKACKTTCATGGILSSRVLNISLYSYCLKHLVNKTPEIMPQRRGL